MKKQQKVIFICTGNSSRSQIAEGFLKNLPNNDYHVYSAGSQPSKVHPNAIAVMKELDIDISGHTSDSIDSYINMGIDIVITVCENAKQVCPVFPGELVRLHWNIEDPFKGWKTNSIQLNNFRKVRDKIKSHVENFIKNRE
tara:strand:+ start:211 stop:633 length:423 start_codon:yes stop_codon:yes gene_type:complete